MGKQTEKKDDGKGKRRKKFGSRRDRKKLIDRAGA